MSQKAWKPALALLLFSLVLLLVARQQSGENFREFGTLEDSLQLLPEEQCTAVEELFQKKLAGQSLDWQPEGLMSTRGPVFLRLRRDGRVLAEASEDAGNWGENLKELLSSFPGEGLFGATVAELEFCHGFEPFRWNDEERLKDLNLKAGIWGVEMLYGGVLERYSPHSLCNRNLTFQNARYRFLTAQDQDPRATPRKSFESRAFRSLGLLVSLTEEPRSVPLYRGRALLEPKQKSEEVDELRELLVETLTREALENGRLPYLYYPVVDEVSYRREMVVRQGLALWALARLARQNPEQRKALESAMAPALRYYFSTDGERGYVTPPAERDNRGIGEIALFGLALQEGPLRGRYPEIERALLAATDAQWFEDGSFASIIGDPDKTRGADFYPGETLLYWSHLYRRDRDPKRLEKLMKSFEYYRNYHLKESRKAAFVPWQTQAWVNVWESTKNPELKDFVFEMNDWLLQMCLWEDAPTLDLRGAFWDPERPEQGSVPHVSSTGVYLEGLAAAYRLAVAVGDESRIASYKQAIQRGIFSLRQHQYQGFDDLYFTVEPRRTRGMLRSQLSNQRVRIDNNAHALLALLSYKELLEPGDYEFGNAAE